MDLHLKNQVALVTGGSTGLGRAIAILFAEEGAKVAINYIVNPDEAELLAQELTAKFGIEAVAVYADVSREDDVLAMMKTIETRLGPVDALVNNAAYLAKPACVDLSLEEFQRCVEVNLQGMFLCCREVIRRMIERKVPGKIVNV
ncbi:MAG: SDR family NAD(P)-dependent oxidoreductase, partial [Planctomycetaceae bacterium]|nr:SDR family NAD(P)-dependent oxidoreductase [Planctomycetaceae bacterium]